MMDSFFAASFFLFLVICFFLGKVDMAVLMAGRGR